MKLSPKALLADLRDIMADLSRAQYVEYAGSKQEMIVIALRKLNKVMTYIKEED